ncbi:MAG: Transcriptional regulator, LysR-family [Blastococcus sp.]|jgi:DNA-binding transcriptional LysR family regulator|nr:Transcriptional regulator, LysR-family [Blastococcus sp.]
MALSEYASVSLAASRHECTHAPRVELRQLEHFLAVVEEGSFTAAAGRLYMVQSSLSASLLSLERTLGTDLFIRGRRGAELTDAGRALVEPARAALRSLQVARDAVAEVSGLLHGTVRIACLPSSLPVAFDIGRTIRLFNQKYPGVEVKVVRAGAPAMVGMVAEGQVDFAVTPSVEGKLGKLSFQSLIRTELGLVCPAEHRLAGARNVEPQDYLDELILDLPRGWQARELFDRVLAEQGAERKTSLEVDDWVGALALANRGTGIAYGPIGCIADTPFAGLDVATIVGAPTWELGIATRDEALRGAAGRAFLAAYLRDCASTQAELI